MAAKRRKKAADATEFSEGARAEGLDNISKLASSAAKANEAKGIGHNSGGITDDELKRQVDHCTSLYNDLMAAKAIYDAASGAWRAGLDIAKEAGAPKKALIEYIQGKHKRKTVGDGPMIAHARDMGRIARLMGDPIGTQWGLWDVRGDDEVNPATGKAASSAMDAELQGQAAYRNNEPKSNNPYQPGTEDYVSWDTGWESAMAHTAHSMGPKPNGATSEAAAS